MAEEREERGEGLDLLELRRYPERRAVTLVKIAQHCSIWPADSSPHRVVGIGRSWSWHSPTAQPAVAGYRRAVEDRENESADPAGIVTVEELEAITRRLRETAVVDEPVARDALRLVETIHFLRAALEDTLNDFELIGILHPRARERDVREVRAEALREAAQLVRDGAGADRLERIASEAEPEWVTLEQLAEDVGIDLDELRREDSE